MDRNNYILDASGKQMFAVGGRNAYATHDAGQYIVSTEWFENEPAMFIWSKIKPMFAFGICLSSIGKYAEPDGRPNAEGVEELALALPDFGKAMERSELHRLIDVVLRYTPELIAMPPVPLSVRREDAGGALWEVTEKDDKTGRTISEASI